MNKTQANLSLNEINFEQTVELILQDKKYLIDETPIK